VVVLELIGHLLFDKKLKQLQELEGIKEFFS